MANINLRVDDLTKKEAFTAFKKLGISPSDAMRTFLNYVARTGKMPVHEIILSEEEYQLVKKRIQETDKHRVTTLDELFS